MADGTLDAAELDAMTFEQLLAALERLTERMAAGDIGIEEAASLYEEAGQLHRAATARLAAVEARIARLRDASPSAPLDPTGSIDRSGPSAG